MFIFIFLEKLTLLINKNLLKVTALWLAHTYVHGSSPDTERQRGCTGSSGTWVCSSRDSVKKVSLPAYRHAIVAALAVYSYPDSFIYLLRKRINKSTLPLFFFSFSFFCYSKGQPSTVMQSCLFFFFFYAPAVIDDIQVTSYGKKFICFANIIFLFLV